ncbi:MAG: endolytic transglycosylase MltG, partial [Deferribacteraceae bacterium]|nr:endolytic transglycosylase MltG [Deferribacteraceae bacterium]
MVKSILFSFAALILLCALTAGGWLYRCASYLDNTMVLGEYSIEKGESFYSFYNKVFLEHNPPFALKSYLIMKGYDKKVHFGEYIADNITIGELLSNIITGKQNLLKLTIPEGYNMYDIAAALEAAGISSRSEMLSTFKDRKVVEKLSGVSYESLEGFLAPGTYFFAKNLSSEQIAKTLVEEFFRTLPENFEPLVKRNGLSFYDALIIASIVQKETYIESEAPFVAAVFINRMKKRMRMQADPTIIYGKYESYDGTISKRDLQDRENRFNTYTHNGLPPTPISNPSVIALTAVANPTKTDFIYFVAKQDGTHVFSKSYAE